jgi:glycosyltransferase involved in cell wall biosynthesis
MRIAEIVNNLEFGGAERLVTDLSLELQSRGHQLYIFSVRGGGPLSEVLAGGGIDVCNLDKKDGFSWAALHRLATLLKSNRIDVVHTHNPLTHHYGVLAGKLARVPAIVNTLHGLLNINGFGRDRIIYELSTALTDRIVAVCPAAEDYFRKTLRLTRAPIHLINNGISTERFARIEPASRADGIVLGTVARLVPVKDQTTLLRAFAQLQRKHRNCRLEILGDGPLRESLESLSRQLAISDHVRFFGAGLDVPAFLQGVHLFVLSSLSEALPLTMLEAMAAGLPILATTVGQIPALIDRAGCGWLCPPGSPELLAETMAVAIRSGELETRGARGREMVIRDHSLFRMGADYEALFEELLNTSRRKRRAVVSLPGETI